MKTLLALMCVLLCRSFAAADVSLLVDTPTTNGDGSTLTDLTGIEFFVRMPPADYSVIATGTLVTSVAGTTLPWSLATAQTGTYCVVAYGVLSGGMRTDRSNELCKWSTARVLPAQPVLRSSEIVLGPATYPTTTVGMSRYKSVAVTNRGPVALTITAVRLLGPDPDFRLAVYTLPRVVPPGASTPFRVYFAPMAAGTRYTVLRITTDQGEQDLPLSGAGVQ